MSDYKQLADVQNDDESAEMGKSAKAIQGIFKRHRLVFYERMKDAGRIRASSDARHHGIGKRSKALEALFPAFVADH